MGITLGFLGCSDHYSPCMHVIASGCGMCHMYSMHQVWVGRPFRLAHTLSTFMGRCGGRLKDNHAGAFNILEDVHTLSLYSPHSDLFYYIPGRTCKIRKIFGKVKYNSKRRRLTIKFSTNSKGRGATFECKIENRRFRPCKLTIQYKAHEI